MSEAARAERAEPGRRTRPEILALPNLISLSRILLTPVFVWMALARRPWEAFVVFLVAGATDALDGFAARRLRLRTSAGLWLDPAGDKILLTAAFIVLSIPSVAAPNTLPLWLTGICIGRDVAIAGTALVLVALRGMRTFKPVLAGKASTICQVLVLYVVLFLNALGRSSAVLPWLYALTAALTLVSWAQYGIIGIGMLRRRPPAGL